MPLPWLSFALTPFVLKEFMSSPISRDLSNNNAAGAESALIEAQEGGPIDEANDSDDSDASLFKFVRVQVQKLEKNLLTLTLTLILFIFQSRYTGVYYWWCPGLKAGMIWQPQHHHAKEVQGIGTESATIFNQRVSMLLKQGKNWKLRCY